MGDNVFEKMFDCSTQNVWRHFATNRLSDVSKRVERSLVLVELAMTSATLNIPFLTGPSCTPRAPLNTFAMIRLCNVVVTLHLNAYRWRHGTSPKWQYNGVHCGFYAGHHDHAET